MQRFVNTHVAGSRRSVISREDIATKRSRNNNQHEKLGIVLDRLENDQLPINESNTVLADIIAVCRMQSKHIRWRER
jgi:hypothetical protein